MTRPTETHHGSALASWLVPAEFESLFVLGSECLVCPARQNDFGYTNRLTSEKDRGLA